MAEKVILCFGDSNTHGTMPMAAFGDRGRFDRNTRWPGAMAKALGPGYHVIEEGHPGRTTVHCDPYDGDHKNGAMVLPAVLESHAPIDLLLIMLGTNDLKSMFSVGPQDIALSLERLVRIARAAECGPSGATPEIVLIIPADVVETGIFAEMFAGGAAKSGRLAKEIGAAAERLGARSFDANSVISVDAQEGIHFDGESHRQLGRAMAVLVSKIL